MADGTWRFSEVGFPPQLQFNIQSEMRTDDNSSSCMGSPHNFVGSMQTRLAERNQKGAQRRFCLKVSLEQKQTVLHYQPRKTRPFFKVVVATPNLVAQSRGDTS